MLHLLAYLWILAQTPISVEWWAPLASNGGMGIVLIWFMIRAEKLWEKMRTAIERNTHAAMISVLTTKHLDEAIRPTAEKIRDDAKDALDRK